MAGFLRGLLHSFEEFNRSWTGRLITLVVIIVVAVAIYAIRLIFFPDLPASVKVYDVIQTNKVWSEDERQRFYHYSQGSEVMPYEWFMALEQADSRELFISNDYMSKFRFLPDPDPIQNPSLLPVGFAKDDPDPVTGVQNIGLSCALCHTAMITYNGMGIRVDGAPGIFNFDSFLQELIVAVTVTDASQFLLHPGKFDRFAHRVLRDKYSAEAANNLHGQLSAWLKEKIDQQAEQLAANNASGQKPTKGGFGRLDALGTGGNTLYRKLTPANLALLNAPVKAVPLWYAPDYDWVQSNGSIRQPLARNSIEAMAVNAFVALPGNPPSQRYVSSVRPEQMYQMETSASKLEAPKWPEGILGPIDQGKVAKGQALYAKYCSTCHSPKIEPAPLCIDDIAVKYKKRFFMLRLFGVNRIGTDPLDATNFATRKVDATAMGINNPPTPAPTVIQNVVGGVLRRALGDLGFTLEQMEEKVGYRRDCWRAVIAYPARPLDGTWAVGRYLHNGSVPNLYELLLPASQRSKTFYNGSTEFDPVKVGYQTSRIRGGFKLDVSLPGNSNSGHEFRNAPEGTTGVIGPELADDERWALVEYMKVINEMPAAKEAASKEPVPAKCWTDPAWPTSCDMEPLKATSGGK